MLLHGGGRPLVLGREQLGPLLMHDIEHGAAGDQVLLVSAVAEVGLTAARGVREHLVADRVAQATGDADLLWCVPGGVGGDFGVAIGAMADADTLDGDGAEGGDEGVGTGAAPLDPLALVAVADV